MSRAAPYSLIWSSFHQTYTLYERQGDIILDVTFDDSSWLGWLSQVSSFAFHGINGSYTANKEYKQRGTGYWYAYARVDGKLSKRYLGRSVSLTPTRLEQAAHALHFATLENGQQKNDLARTPPVDSYTPAGPLLATKLRVPYLRPYTLHRPRLIQRLQHSTERALTLISAPVGFGKSTLLADWLNVGAISAAWLSLEPEDNEPTRFLTYLLAALHTDARHLSAASRVLHAPLHASSIEATLTLLINDFLLQKASSREPFIIVLDNYQVIMDRAIHHALIFLLDHLPQQLHLVLATREDPPLPLAQLRARDDLLELRATDLRFNLDEATAFLRGAMDLSLSSAAIELLQRRTEGWITGLQLAAISLQGHEDAETFITAFSGNNQYIMDYLLEEVLHRQSQSVQDFLLQTSILDRLSAPLCDTVRQRDDSQSILNFLERANLFLVALDNERHWYRYHRLFAEALRQQLQQTMPELVPRLHLRASLWYEQQGLFSEAAPHILQTPPPLTEAFLEPLTMREREVLQLLMSGASNREIGRQLVLSMNTVKKHVLNICRKLQVRSRAQAVAKAQALSSTQL